MISRAVCTPRVCLSCRLGLARRTGAVAMRLPPSPNKLVHRYASNSSGPADKNLMEDLISGKTDLEDYRKNINLQKSREANRLAKLRRRGKAEDDEWPEDDSPKRAPTDDVITPDIPDRSKQSTREARDELPEDVDEFDWRGSARDPLEVLGSTQTTIRHAASPDEDFPEDGRFSWRRSSAESADLVPEKQDSLNAQEGPAVDEYEELAESEELETSSEGRTEEASDVFNDDVSHDGPTQHPVKSGDTDRTPNRRVKDSFFRQEQLDIQALGEQAGALVISNPDHLTRKRRKAQETVEDPLPMQHFDMDFRAQDPQEDTEETMFKLIDDLRPEDTPTLSKNKFVKLANTLRSGFTIKQLLAYLESRGTSTAPRPAQVFSYPWLTSHTTWKSTAPSSTLNSILRVGRSAKDKAVRDIMMHHWGLLLQEESEALGQVTANVSPHIVQVLSQPHVGAMNLVTEGLLDGSIGETMTARLTNRQPTIEIHSRKALIPTIFSRLDEVIQSIKTRVVDASESCADISDEVLNELARVTKAVIKRSSHGKSRSLAVSWVQDHKHFEDSTVPARGDAADAVLRLLRSPDQRFGNRRLMVCRDQKQAGRARAIPYTRENRSMYWQDRLKRWVRHSGQMSSTPEDKDKRLDLNQKVNLPSPDSALEDSVAELSASFGHVLEQHESGRASHTANRILLPVVPHPAAFSDILPENDSEVVQTTSIILNFTPASEPKRKLSPEVQGTRPGSLPNLRFTLPIKSESDLVSIPEGATLKAVTLWDSLDVLAYEEDVDARITQSRETSLDVSQQGLNSFIQSSTLDLAADRIHTPRGVEISIPQSWVKSSTEGSFPYLFAGAEVHQTADMPWKGHTLRYNAIEAGPEGGSRQELSLVGKVTPDDKATAAEKKASFLRVLEMAMEGRFWSWTAGAAKAQELPDDSDPRWEQAGYAPIEAEEDYLDEAEEAEDWEADELSIEPEKDLDEYDLWDDAADDSGLPLELRLDLNEPLQVGDEVLAAGAQLIRRAEYALSLDAQFESLDFTRRESGEEVSEANIETSTSPEQPESSDKSLS